jgi:Family of unknown function (DUF6502)
MLKPRAEVLPDAALLQALARVLSPAARLAVSRGLRFAVAEEIFKRAFIEAARQAPADGAVPTVSSIAIVTGLTRREVTRLTQDTPASAAERPSLATQVFTLWRAERSLRDSRGRSKPLSRLGPAPSFEALAQSVTRDVHPRTLLDELCRLGLAHVDAATDRVHLIQDAFVPRDDLARMLHFLGSNVGDHLAATVANVLGDERKHFEQAVFAEGLSDESIDAAKKLVNAQWRALMAAIVPELEALVEDDRQAKARNRTHRAQRRLRIGLYSFDEDGPRSSDQETKE